MWQVVDGGIAQMFKVLTRHNYQKWLDEGDNVDIWSGIKRVSQQWNIESNIEYSQWVGNVLQELCSSKYNHLRKHYWEKTGCLIAADKLEDAKITLEDLADYKVPQPLLNLPACEAEPRSNTPDTTGNDKEKQEEETLEEELEKPENGQKNLKIAKTVKVKMSCVDESQRAV